MNTNTQSQISISAAAAFILSFLLLAMPVPAKADDAEKIQRIAATEASLLERPKKPLSSYAQFELEHMTIASGIRKSKGKMEKARELELKLKAKTQPLLRQWNAANKDDSTGKLLIRPHLQKLRIISSGARSLGTVWTGNSFIDLEIALIDASNGEEISRVLIYRNSGQTQEFSLSNKNDRLVIDYVASIAYAYLAGNNELTGTKTLESNQSLQATEDLFQAALNKASQEIKKTESLNEANIQNSADDENPDISGTYVSEITSNSRKIFKKTYQTLEVILKQNRHRVTGVGGSGAIQIDGVFAWDNTILFSTGKSPFSCNCSYLSGEWVITSDGARLEGKWTDGKNGGKWNLIKVE